MRVLILAGLLIFQSSKPSTHEQINRLVAEIEDLVSQKFQQGPEHGKPASCDNFKDTPIKCDCSKAKHSDCDEPDPDVSGDETCVTYSRRQNCHCMSKCQTMRRVQ
jgi:hypothetical protein